MKRPLVQILVVVANIQMRTLKTEVGKVSTWIALSRGLVVPKSQGSSVHVDFCLSARKGSSRFIFSLHTPRMWIINGNISEIGDARGGPGKRCLFFLTVYYPEIRLSGDRVKWRVKQVVIRPVRCALDRPWKSDGMFFYTPRRTNNRIRSPRLAASGQ